MNKVIVRIIYVLLCLSLTSCTAKSSKPVSSQEKQTAEPGAAVAPARAQGETLNYVKLTEKKEQLGDIRTAKVGAQTFGDSMQLSSTVDSPNDQTATIFSQVSGVATKVPVDVGDHVRAGQIVAVVSSPDLADLQSTYLDALARLDEKTAQVKLVRTRLDVSKTNQERTDTLVNEGIAARADADNARATVAASDSELVAAKTAVIAAKAELRALSEKLKALGLPEPSRSTNNVATELSIRTPLSGTVTQRNVHPGQSVGPASMSSASHAAALLTIANLNKVWVMLEVPQSQVAKVPLGTHVQFKTDVAPGQTFVGTVTRLGENFDPQSRCVMVRTEIDNHRGVLKPGMVVIATASGTERKAVATVPPSAIQNIDGKDCVFVAWPNHTYERREVRCGDRTENAVRIEHGLEAGESVVTNGSFFLKTEAVRSSIGENAG